MPTVPTLATARLLLRPVVPADAPAIVALLADDHAAVEYTAAIPWPVTLDNTRAWIAALPDGDELAWTVLRADTGALVGGVGLRGAGRVMHLGYWIGREARGQGYATEAARAAVAHARALGAWEVRAEVMVGNAASVRVLVALGFRHTGDATRSYPVRVGARHVQEFALVLKAEA